MVAFWQQALHYVPREPPRGGWVVLCDPEHRGPNLSFQARETARPARNWLHLDLYTDNQKAEVERLVRLGAVRASWQYPAAADYVVLEDPWKSLLCRSDGRNGDRALNPWVVA